MTMERLILPTVLCCVIAYFLCGIPFGLLITKAKGIDIRKVGSGNIGSTNVARAAGVGASALTLALDAGKGFVSVMIAKLLIPVLGQVEYKALAPDQTAGVVIAIVYLAGICGHIFSIYLKFHGGKGIATGLGCALAFKWQMGLILLALFIAIVVPTRYVSLGSCCAAAALPIMALIFGVAPISIVPLAAVGGLVIWAHRSNIKKLINGQESRFSFNSEKKA